MRSAYGSLVDRFGAERVADALIAKWLSDEDGDQKWFYLAKAINNPPGGHAPSRAYLTMTKLRERVNRG